VTSGEAPLEASATALSLFDLRDVLEELRRTPPLLSGERDEVVETVGRS
jgi:hypothetical protein